MLSLNNYTKEFKRELKQFIFDYDNDENELKRLDSKIIKELDVIISDTTNFAVPFMPTKYPKYNENKSLDTFNLNIPIAYEFDFEQPKKQQIIPESQDILAPYIIFVIPNIENKLALFSKLIGQKIEGDLVFMVRKYKGRWELPLKGISITPEKIKDVIIFKSLHFELEVEKSSDLLFDANKYHKELLSNKIEEFSYVCLNNKENLFASKNGLIVAESFLSKKSKDDVDGLSKKINENKNGLFYLNALYNISIAF